MSSICFSASIFLFTAGSVASFIRLEADLGAPTPVVGGIVVVQIVVRSGIEIDAGQHVEQRRIHLAPVDPQPVGNLAHFGRLVAAILNISSEV